MTGLFCAAALTTLGGASWLTYMVAQPRGARLGGLLTAYERRLDSDAAFVSVRVDGATMIRAQLAASACFLAFAVVLHEGTFLGLGAASAIAPPLVLRRRHRARVLRLEGQLDGWILLLANALRATPALGDAIASTSMLMPGDFGREVKVLTKELKLGVSVDRALRSLAGRIGSDVVSAAISVIVVARRTGGDLSTALEESAASLRETARLEGVLRTKTAEGRGQVVVLSLAPFVLCVLIAWLEPAWFDATLEHHFGRMLIAGCSLLWLVATIWAHRIVEAPL